LTDVTFVTGTAGSGKSLLTSTLKKWYVEKGENAIAVNLDPGVINLPYEPDVDIRQTVDLNDIMDQYELGPNGALIFATDMIATRLDSIQEEMESFNAEYAFIDTPGQTELFAFRESGEYIVKELRAESKVLLFLMDPLLADSPVNFLSLALLSASVGLRMNIPRISVLSKRDLAKDKVKQAMEWVNNSRTFEDALSSTKNADQYSLYSELFRGLRKLSFGVDLYPVSSVTREGIVALVGEMARISRGGEEITD